MYDTVNLELKQAYCKDISLIDHVGPKLDNITPLEVNKTLVLTGYLNKKLAVNVTEKRIKIKKGNLKHYFFSNPFYDFKRGSFEEAIMMLSDELQLPMDKADVTRIDIGPTLSMKQDARLYFNHLGYAKGYKRNDMDNGIVYKGSSDAFAIYHKQNQLEETGKPIPKDKKGRNHLRAELRVTKNLSDYFKKENIIAKDLYDERFYIQVIDKWKETYYKISKISDELNSIEPSGKVKDFLQNLACIGLSTLDQGKVLSTVKEWQRKGFITPKQAYDLRDRLMELNSINLEVAPSELMSELDEKIENVADTYR